MRLSTRPARHSKLRWSVEFRGKLEPLEHILSTRLRCELVREGTIPIDIELVIDDEAEALWVRAGGAPDHLLKLSHGWFHYLFRAAPQVLESSA